MPGRAWTPEEQIRVAELYYEGLRGDELKSAHDGEFGTPRSIISLENAVHYKEIAGRRYAELRATPSSSTGRVEWEPASGVLTSVEVRTLDEAMAYADLDPSDWNVDALTLKPYQTAQKLRRGCTITEGCTGGYDETVKIQLMAMHAKLSPRFGRASLRALIEGMGVDIARQAEALPMVEPANMDAEGFLLEVNAPDLHLGKYAYAPETGDTQTIETAKDRFRTAIRTMVSQALLFGPISRIVFPVGNDFLHVGTDSRTTVRGTPQDVHGRWVQLMREGRQLLSQVIREDLLPLAPVDVVVISGNHARHSEWALGEILAAEFANTEHVAFDNEPVPRKYYPYGKVLLGFTHGNEEKWVDLPAIMAREAGDAWGHSIYREWHVGHEHRKTVKLNEENDVPVVMVQSLSGLDAWHNLKGYSGTPGAMGFLWTPEGPGPMIPYTIPRRPEADPFTGPKIDRSF